MTEPHYHASSAIIIRKEDDRVFLGRRRLSKPLWPGLWETVGGGIEEGETPEECLRREIREELGVEIASVTVYRDYVSPGRRVRVFLITLQADPEPNRSDFEEWGWMRWEVVKDKEFAADCKERVKDWFALLQSGKLKEP